MQPVQVTFNLNPGGHRDARFMAGDDSFVEFWIQESTNLPEEFSLFAKKSNYRLMNGRLVAAQDGDILRFTVGDTGKSYIWAIGSPITNPAEMQKFLDFAEGND